MCTCADGDAGNLGVIEAGRQRAVRSMVEQVVADGVGGEARRELVTGLRETLLAASNGDLVRQVGELFADQAPRLVAQFAQAVEEIAFGR